MQEPLDINEPTTLDPSNDADFSEIIALMLMTTTTDRSIRGLRPGFAEVDMLTIHEQPSSEPDAYRAY